MKTYITGLGLITAAGQTVQDTWQSLLNGQTGIAPITTWDLRSWSASLGGELKDFNAAKALPDRKLMKAISRQDAMGIAAAMQAVQHSAVLPFRDGLANPADFNDMTGVFVGSPGNKYLQQYDFLPLLAKTGQDMQAFGSELFNEVHPMWLLRILPNNVLAYTGILNNFKGPNHNITNHAVSGAQALLEAHHAIQSGQIDRAVVVAYDLGIDPQALFYYNKLGLLSADGLNPFDKAHNGTILADGAAAIVLESEASANARNATCLAQFLGGKTSTENAGLFGLEREATELERVMHITLPKQDNLALVIAHGNGNKPSDDTESLALSRYLANDHPPLSAFKWAMGHTLCASALVDTVLAVQALNERCLPGIAPLKIKSPAATALNFSHQTRALNQGDTALIINRGFASMNACLAIKACDSH